MTAVAIEPEPVPLTRDQAGRLMVDRHARAPRTLVAAFERGDSPESIQESYPSVSLGDIDAVFTYCMRHCAEVNVYLAGRAEQRADMESRFPPEGCAPSCSPGWTHDDHVPGAWHKASPSSSTTAYVGSRFLATTSSKDRGR